MGFLPEKIARSLCSWQSTKIANPPLRTAERHKEGTSPALTGDLVGDKDHYNTRKQAIDANEVVNRIYAEKIAVAISN